MFTSKNPFKYKDKLHTLAMCGIERRIAAAKNVHYDTKWPNITGYIIFFKPKNLLIIAKKLNELFF